MGEAVCTVHPSVCVCESLIARHASAESVGLTADIESHGLLASTGLSLTATPAGPGAAITPTHTVTM